MNIITLIRCLIGSFGLHDVLIIRFSKAVYSVPLGIVKDRYKLYLLDQEYRADRIEDIVRETFNRDSDYIKSWIRYELSWSVLEKNAQKVRNYGQGMGADELHYEFPCAHFEIRG